MISRVSELERNFVNSVRVLDKLAREEREKFVAYDHSTVEK